jgi:N-acetylneuraminate synthase
MRYKSSFLINGREIGLDCPTYFIADVASNHDGDLARAKALIWKAAEAGADAIKFQHFMAKSIVSDYGFRNLGGQLSHQAKWKKSVYEVYEDYQLNRSWNDELAAEAKAAGIDFMTTPYDSKATEECAPLVAAFKVGSGDITWSKSLVQIAQQGKPVILATGASEQHEVTRAVDAILAHTGDLCLMQCNTNYTGDFENFKYINLNVLRSFALQYPGLVLGLSDHTPGHAAVLGAVTLGARMIEKHFTDDNSRVGPDHAFSMTPASWREMVDRSRELQAALGDGVKRIEANELDTVVVQRRCLRLTRDLPAGTILSDTDLEALRPAPSGSVPPYLQGEYVGRALRVDKVAGDALNFNDIEVNRA